MESFCEEIVDLAELDRRIKNPNHYFGVVSEGSISSVRKGKLANLLKNEAPSIVADIKSKSCVYCGIPFACGADRLNSKKSYPLSIHDDELLPCDSTCNVIMMERTLDDILVQMCLIVIHVAKNWDTSDQIASIFTCPTDGMLTHRIDNRKLVKCTITVELSSCFYHKTQWELLALKCRQEL